MEARRLRGSAHRHRKHDVVVDARELAVAGHGRAVLQKQAQEHRVARGRTRRGAQHPQHDDRKRTSAPNSHEELCCDRCPHCKPGPVTAQVTRYVEILWMPRGKLVEIRTTKKNLIGCCGQFTSMSR